jgi:hypothetical protein
MFAVEMTFEWEIVPRVGEMRRKFVRERVKGTFWYSDHARVMN